MANTRPLPPSDINPWAKSIEVDVDGLLTRMDRAISDASAALRTANAAIAGLTSMSARYSIAPPVTQSGITTATGVSSVSVTVDLQVATDLRVEGLLRHYATNIDTVIAIQVLDGASVVATWTRSANSGTTAGNAEVSNFFAILPGVAAGTHVYTLSVSRATGTGSITISPIGDSASFLSVGPV